MEAETNTPLETNTPFQFGRKTAGRILSGAMEIVNNHGLEEMLEKDTACYSDCIED